MIPRNSKALFHVDLIAAFVPNDSKFFLKTGLLKNNVP